MVQGKEKRSVEGTHQALVDKETFELIQQAFSEREKKQTGNNTGTENILRGKVICGCCGGKLQRRYGRNREWAFFSCITNNRLGIEKCTGMYIREDDIMNAIYTELNTLADEYYISETEYKAHKQNFDKEFADIVLLNSGVDLKIVSEHLGHCDIGVTANIYADVLKSTKAKVADLVSLKLA